MENRPPTTGGAPLRSCKTKDDSSLSYDWRDLRDRDTLVQIDILDRVQQLHTFGHRALKSLAAGDHAHSAGTLVDDRGAYRVAEVVVTGRPTGQIGPIRPR